MRASSKFLLILCLLMTILQFGAFAHEFKGGTVKGVIRTADGQPARFVSISIDNAGWGDISNDSGEYSIKNIRPGHWTIRIAAVGLQELKREIDIRENQTLEIDFTINETAVELQEVIVRARTNSSVDNASGLIAKMPLKNLENPQVYNSVGADLMTQQAVTNYDDAMRNVPGIAKTWSSTGRAGDGASYFALRGLDAQPFLVNGLPGLTSGDLDPADVAEIIVLKGPSAALYGGSMLSYGGMINTITKQPYFEYGGEAGYQFGSFGLNRVTADVNLPLSKTQKIALRVNTALHSENSFQDAGFKKSFFIAPALTYEVNDRLTFKVLMEVLEENRAVPPVFFNSDRLSPLPFKNLEELNLNRDLSFTSNDLTIKNPKFNVQAQMLYRLSDKWTSQTVVSGSSIKADGIYTYIWDDVPGDNLFSQYFHNELTTTTTLDVQQNFNGDFMIGPIRNRLLLGLDIYHRNVIDNGSAWAWGRNVTPQGQFNYVDPFTGKEAPELALTKAGIDNLLSASPASLTNITNNSYSAYASDVINLTPRLSAMLSLRADYNDSKGERSIKDDDFHQWAFSPKLGLVYQPIMHRLSVFVNYMNGFINVAPIQVANPDGSNARAKSFKPEHANQWEAGFKAQLINDKLQATVSYYDIRVSDRVVSDPTNINNQIQGGKVGSKGLEIDLSTQLTPGLNLIAGYAHNETKVLAGNSEDFYSEPGRAPGGQGPADMGNFWANYTIKSGGLKNFGIGLGANVAGSYKVIDNSVTGVFTLPGYQLFNGSVFYDHPKYRLSINLNNFTNEAYYIGYWSVNPQQGRSFVASLAFKF